MVKKKSEFKYFLSTKLEDFVEHIKSLLSSHNNAKIALLGELGSGKTTLVKHILAKFAPSLAKQVSSPSFSYCNIYNHDITVAHFDLYRLHNMFELDRIGVWDFLSGPEIVFIEWANKFESIVNSCDFKIEILIEDKIRRYILH